jgi:Flp pilus assembly pilin Flp
MDREEGQTLSEYGLILMTIVIVAVVALALFGGQVVNFLNRAAQAL